MLGTGDFNSRTSCEVRPVLSGQPAERPEFQLTHLLRGATRICTHTIWACTFQLTHLLRGATIAFSHLLLILGFQLTHLLRGATTAYPVTSNFSDISTHAPLARCDHEVGGCGIHARFQLTHLLRGATIAFWLLLLTLEFQLTHLLRGATPPPGGGRRDGCHFNSRTSCEVRQPYAPYRITCVPFQLTHLLRGATWIQ